MQLFIAESESTCLILCKNLLKIICYNEPMKTFIIKNWNKLLLVAFTLFALCFAFTFTIDDNAKNIEVAKALDFITIHITPETDLEKELKDLGLKF